MKNLEYSIFKNIFYKFLSLYDLLIKSFFTQKNVEINNAKKIGIILQWGIGDSVISTNLINTIKKELINSDIYIIGKNHNKTIFYNFFKSLKFINLNPPWSDKERKYNLFSFKYLIFIKNLLALRRIHFDILITTRFDVRDRLQLLFLNSKNKIYFSGFSNFNSFTISYSQYLKQNSYEIINSICIDLFKKYHPISSNLLDKNNDDSFSKIMNLKDQNYVLFHGGSSEKTKNFCIKCNGDLLLKLCKNHNVVLVKDPSYDFNSIIDFLLSNGINVTIFFGSLKELIFYISNSNFVICCDSGPYHLASVLNVTTYCFFVNEAQKNKWKSKNKNSYFSYMHKRGCKQSQINQKVITYRN